MPYSKTPDRQCLNCGLQFHRRTNSAYCETCRFVKKECVVCGTVFEVRRIHNHVKTCSYKCGAISRWGDAETVTQRRADRRPPCAWCGKPITRKNIGYGKSKAKNLFCCRSHSAQHRVQTLRGENHPNWRGGYTGYYGPSWRRQRALARKRDQVCQQCGKTPAQNGKALDVHHIQPFREFGLDRHEEANQLDNLICYCANCHQLIEWQYEQVNSVNRHQP